MVTVIADRRILSLTLYAQARLLEVIIWLEGRRSASLPAPVRFSMRGWSGDNGSECCIGGALVWFDAVARGLPTGRPWRALDQNPCQYVANLLGVPFQAAFHLTHAQGWGGSLSTITPRDAIAVLETLLLTGKICWAAQYQVALAWRGNNPTNLPIGPFEVTHDR